MSPAMTRLSQLLIAPARFVLIPKVFSRPTKFSSSHKAACGSLHHVISWGRTSRQVRVRSADHTQHRPASSLAPHQSAIHSHALRRPRHNTTAQAEAKSSCSPQLPSMTEPAAMEKVHRFLASLVDFEKQGVPTNAGTDSKEGFELGRMRRLLDGLGSPVEKYQVVHVGGTKGKGSTVTMIAGILQAAGYCVGCYTSPHVTTLCERIAVDGVPIQPAAFAALVEDVQEAVAQAQQEEHLALTHFEVLTALALKHFAREKVDFAIIEVGLGGTRDATNVIPEKSLALAVLTTIAEEHLAALGGSLESIAHAKAGILKPGRAAILGSQSLPLVTDIVRTDAEAIRAPLLVLDDLLTSQDGKSSLTWHDEGLSWLEKQSLRQKCSFSVQEGDQALELKEVHLQLVGPHQVRNACTAILAALQLRKQGWHIPDMAIRSGLEEATLLGRFQLLPTEHTEQLGLSGHLVVLDGAHTPDSSTALASTLQASFQAEDLVLVMAMSSDKDQIGSVRALSKVNPATVIVTRVPVTGSFQRSTPSSSLREAWEEVLVDDSRGSSLARSVSIIEAESMREALELAKEHTSKIERVICITGSMHAVAEVLNILRTEVDVNSRC